MLLYLHGFASGPDSFKARAFRERLGALGVPVEVPALDEGDFEHLTISRQLRLVERLMVARPSPRVLIGSSLGGYLAALHASRHPADALVLMAPAVDFASRWAEKLGPELLAQWRRDGRLDVEHHALGRMAPLSVDFVEDAALHAPYPVVGCPTLVLHGRRDDVVPQERVERFASVNPTARLVLLDSAHELTDCVDTLVELSRRFLAGIPAVARHWPRLAQPDR